MVGNEEYGITASVNGRVAGMAEAIYGFEKPVRK